MILRSPSHRTALRQFHERCTVPQPATDWPQAESDCVRQLRPDAAAILQADVPGPEQAAWEACGLLARSDDGRYRFAARLADGFMPLFEAGSATPFDLLLADGLLLGEETPAYAVAHDGRTADQLASSEGMLCLVPTLEDMRYCAALGMAAATTPGWEPLTLPQIRQLEQLSRPRPSSLDRGITEPAEPVEPTAGTDQISLPLPEDIPVELILSAWSFSAGQPTDLELVRHLADRLARAQRCLGLDLSGIGVWCPTAEDTGMLQTCREFRESAALREAILRSLRSRAFHLEAIGAGSGGPLARPPADYLTARSVLLEQLRRDPSDLARMRRAIDDYDRYVEQQIVAPLLQQGVQAANPIAASLQLEVAQVSGLLQRQAPALLREITDVAQAERTDRRRPGLEPHVRLYLQLLDRLVKLAKALSP